MDHVGITTRYGRSDGVAGWRRRVRETRPMAVLGADIPADLDVTCPRCGAEAQQRFAGPCAACRETLRASQGGEQREVAATAYEPKMNVTPNAVATKD